MNDVARYRAGTVAKASRCLEALRQASFQKLAFRPVVAALGQVNRMPGPSEGLIAIADFGWDTRG